MTTNPSHPFRWGIFSPGQIARYFASDVTTAAGHKIAACASSTPGKAEQFASDFSGCRAASSFEAVAHDPDVDAIYIASTHNFHFEQARLALEVGKPVLCEKPLTLNARQARELIELAQANKVFFMEAWWTRFFPAIESLLEEIASGTIGELLLVQADFGVFNDWPAGHRMINPALGGGALLDLGVYPVAFALLVFGGEPREAISLARTHATGVDAYSSYLLAFEHGGHAVLTSSFDVRVPHQARLYGTKGSIVIDKFFHPDAYRVNVSGQEEQRKEFPHGGHGYQFQALEVERCLNEGSLESAKRPLADTLAVMETLDRLRACWGLKYPGET